MKNVWGSYGRNKCKMLKNWIKQEILRRLKMGDNLKIAHNTVKSWLIQIAYTFTKTLIA